MSEQDDREAYNAELQERANAEEQAALSPVPVQAVVRLSWILESAMRQCRRDYTRQMADFDFCEVCPMLNCCISQEKAEKPNTERHAPSGAR